VRARLGRAVWRAYRNPQLRIDGGARVNLVVAGARGGRRLPSQLRKLLELLNA
jgi:hypothetical protein